MKKRLTPFDAECIKMIADLTKVEPQVEQHGNSFTVAITLGTVPGEIITALHDAIKGRFGSRLIFFEEKDGQKVYTVGYDPEGETLPDTLGGEVMEIDPEAGTRYCRTLKEINAVQVDRDNVAELQRFTGGGSMSVPRIPGGIGVYSFITENGLSMDVPETWYIIREDNGTFSKRPKREFDAEFEPKGTRTVGNYDGLPARPSVTKIMELFNELFGTNIASRCRKIEEEFNEYKEVVRAAMPTFDDPAQMNAVIDELADLNAVVFHSAAILGITQRELLEMAYDKVKGRQTDPNYKRTHPHINNNK